MKDVFQAAEDLQLGDVKTTGFARVVRDTLSSISDSPVDVGIGLDCADLWVKYNGREYYITIRASNNQRKEEAN